MLPLNSHSSQEKGNLRGVPERIKETSANCRKEEENPWLRSQRANVKTACQFQRVLSILSHWPAAKAAFRALEVLPPSGTAAVIGKDQLVQSFNPRGFLQQFYLSIWKGWIQRHPPQRQGTGRGGPVGPWEWLWRFWPGRQLLGRDAITESRFYLLATLVTGWPYKKIIPNGTLLRRKEVSVNDETQTGGAKSSPSNRCGAACSASTLKHSPLIRSLSFIQHCACALHCVKRPRE